jgi:hypothetical protein
MKITKLEDVKVGHWITFLSKSKNWDTEEEKIQRKFYKVQIVMNKKDSKKNNLPMFYCSTYKNGLLLGRLENIMYDTVIDNLLINPDKDEIYETFEECAEKYPEVLI